MKFLRDLPVKHKLMVITMLATGTALLMASAAFLIYLEQDSGHLTAPMWDYVLVGILMLVICAGVVLLLSAWLQTVISRPLSALAETVAAVRTNRDYSVRANKQGDDELGSLIDGFNDMLAQIQERDANLERRVNERTVELAKSLSVLDATLSSTADGILVVSPEGKKIFQNQRTAELWKIPPAIVEREDDDAQVQHVMNLVTDPAKFAEQVAHLYAHPDETDRTETELKDGTILERITGPVRDKEGRNYGRIWTFRDVTQRKQYEAALRESQARFKFIFESAPVGIALQTTHPAGRVTREINAAHLRICGLTRDQDAMPDIYASLTHPADQARQKVLMYQIHEGKIRQFTLEKRYLRLDGTRVWVSFSYQRQAYPDGSFEELMTSVDITESKRAEAALSESEANYYSLVDQIPAGIFRKDREGRYVFVNSSFCRMHDARPEDYLGKLPQELPPHLVCGPGSESAAAGVTLAAAQHHASIVESGRPIEAGESRRTTDGRTQYFHVVMSPVLDADGTITGSQGFLFDITGRKQAEAAVNESESLLRSIMDNSRDVIFVKDRACRFVYMNPAGYRLSGATPEKLLGHTKADFHPDPGEAEQFMVDDRRVMESSMVEQIEESIVGADGFKHVFFTTKVARRDSQGTVIGLVGIAHDITERKRAEQALRESEAKYYSLVDQMPAGIFRKDRDGRFVFVNSWYCRLKGGKPEDFLGKMPLETVAVAPGPARSEAATLAAAGTGHHAEIMRTGRQMEFDERQAGENGGITYIHSIKSAVYGSDGSIVGSQGVLLDATQRKQAEEALAYERDLLKALLDSSPDSIYFKDRQSRYTRQSRSEVKNLLRIALGRHRTLYPTDDMLPAHLADEASFRDYLIGKTDADVYGPERAGEFDKDEQEIMRTGKPLVGKIEKIIEPGGIVWFLTTKSAWRNQDGEIIGTFGTSQDITKLKEAEEQIERAHQQLLETSRLAGMAEVATSVLHNVGNVLNSVNVSTTLVLEMVKKSRLNNLGRLAALIQEHSGDLAAFFTTDPRGRQLPEYLSTLANHLADEQAQLTAEVELTRKNIEHIKDIVTMQQSYAKVSGVVETVAVQDLVDDALRMNAGALTRHHVEVVRDFPAEAVECHTERQKVLQILVNVIRNAKYACDESSRPDKRLTMQVRVAGDRVQIVALDNGVGIPAENITRIFSHGFTTREHGHGFGLHSGALAAKELGGSLAAHSDGPGTGARFVLDLPLNSPRTP